MIIDGHIHLYETGFSPISGSCISIDAFLRKMDACGLEKAVVLSLPAVNDNLALLKYIEPHLERFIPFCHLDFKLPRQDALLEVLVKEYGFKGLKIHPRLHGLGPEDARLASALQQAEKMGLPVLFDCYPQSRDIPLLDLHPYAYDRLAKKYPNLTMILAHAGVPNLWDAYFVAKSNPHVYLDISYIIKRFQHSSFIAIDLPEICKQLDQKIIYGSDAPECDPKEYLTLFRQVVDLPPDKLARILGGNMAAILGLEDRHGY